MSRYKKSVLSTVGGALALAAIIAPINPAFAGQRQATTDVSCDGTTIKSLVSVSHTSSGTFSITQNSTNPSGYSRVFATSANGNSLSAQRVGNNNTANWSGVAASTYTAKAYRDSYENCNGVYPGAGNYSLNYTVTYRG